jgi:SAM-dependent methyltransferase
MPFKADQYFENGWSNYYGSPRNIRFFIYDNSMWKLCLKYLNESDLVADYGSGGGTLLYNIDKFSNARLIGIEKTEQAIMQTKSLIPQVNIIRGDILNTPFKSESIDFIFSTMVIEHVDDKKFSEEVFRTLRPGGYFFVTSVIKSKNAWYFYKNTAGETVLEPSHLKEYKSIQEFENILKPRGFTIIKSSAPRICYPLLDPLLKLVVKFTKIKNLIGWRSIEFLRLLTKVPIPGYFAVEVLAKKKSKA